VVGLARFGVSDNFELRLGGPIYTEIRVESGPFDDTDSGYGDLEVGAKWHLLDNQGGQPSFALIPSVILPTGEDGFTADDPVYQLNAMAEWTLASGWGIGALGGYLNGPIGDDRFNQETFALSAGRSLPSPAWSAYGEVVRRQRRLLRRSGYQISGQQRRATGRQLRLRADRRLAGLAVRARSGGSLLRRCDHHGHPLSGSRNRLLPGVVLVRERLRLPGARGGGKEMSALYILGLVVSVLLTVYLFVAFLKPERF
jgi:K+-transporting ATPase KdpF subunit